jgi:hypothetical protein
MLDKMKEFGSQAVSNIKMGAETVVSGAVSVTDSLNEKAIRTSTAQMYNILEIALDELKNRPLADRPLTLKSSVNIGIAALELEIHLNEHPAENKEETNPIITPT